MKKYTLVLLSSILLLAASASAKVTEYPGATDDKGAWDKTMSDCKSCTAHFKDENPGVYEAKDAPRAYTQQLAEETASGSQPGSPQGTGKTK